MDNTMDIATDLGRGHPDRLIFKRQIYKKTSLALNELDGSAAIFVIARDEYYGYTHYEINHDKGDSRSGRDIEFVAFNSTIYQKDSSYVSTVPENTINTVEAPRGFTYPINDYGSARSYALPQYNHRDYDYTQSETPPANSLRHGPDNYPQPEPLPDMSSLIDPSLSDQPALSTASYLPMSTNPYYDNSQPDPALASVSQMSTNPNYDNYQVDPALESVSQMSTTSNYPSAPSAPTAVNPLTIQVPTLPLVPIPPLPNFQPNLPGPPGYQPYVAPTNPRIMPPRASRVQRAKLHEKFDLPVAQRNFSEIPASFKSNAPANIRVRWHPTHQAYVEELLEVALLTLNRPLFLRDFHSIAAAFNRHFRGTSIGGVPFMERGVNPLHSKFTKEPGLSRYNAILARALP